MIGTTPRVRDIMQRDVISVAADTPLPELAQLLTQRMISGTPVVNEDGDVVGVVSLTDLVANSTRTTSQVQAKESSSPYYRDLWIEEDSSSGFLVEDYGSQLQVQDIMTPVVYVINADEGLTELVGMMLGARIHRVLVTDGEAVVGIVTTMDLIRVIPRLLGEEKKPAPPRK